MPKRRKRVNARLWLNVGTLGIFMTWGGAILTLVVLFTPNPPIPIWAFIWATAIGMVLEKAQDKMLGIWLWEDEQVNEWGEMPEDWYEHKLNPPRGV